MTQPDYEKEIARLQASLKSYEETLSTAAEKLNAAGDEIKRLKEEKAKPLQDQVTEQLEGFVEAFTSLGEMSDAEWEKQLKDVKGETAEMIVKVNQWCKGFERVLDVVEETGIVERVLESVGCYINLCRKVTIKSRLHTTYKKFERLFKGK